MHLLPLPPLHTLPPSGSHYGNLTLTWWCTHTTTSTISTPHTPLHTPHALTHSCSSTSNLGSRNGNFTLNNLVACLVATDILQLLGLRSFRTAALLLLGLLAYDVFW